MAAPSWLATNCTLFCSTEVQVRVPSLAKLNLDLRVLDKRADGYHELRTIFQTISLGDELSIGFDFSRRPSLNLASSVDIADNLVLRAAKLVLDGLKIKAQVRISLKKKIPMGAGLGGGSSNAASVLIALPALAGRRLTVAETVRFAKCLGSDVPYFLYGGTALALGRGTELYPLADLPSLSALVVSTGIHVSTAEAYRALNRPNVTNALTSQEDLPILGEFQSIAWRLRQSEFHQLPFKNDFEKPVFALHPELPAVVRKLRRLGAGPALMTGSGSAVFGVFPDLAAATSAATRFPAGTAYPVRFVTRRQYRKLWSRALGQCASYSCVTSE